MSFAKENDIQKTQNGGFLNLLLPCCCLTFVVVCLFKIMLVVVILKIIILQSTQKIAIKLTLEWLNDS